MSTTTTADANARGNRAGLVVRIALVVLCIAAGIFAATKYGTDPAVWFDHAGRCPEWLFFLIVALPPLFGFPLAPIYLFAGATYGVARGLPLTLAGVAVHLCLAYPFYGVMLREPVRRLLATQGFKLPELPEKNRLRSTLLIASVPALPFWAQNAVLSLARVPFPMYFTVSLGVQTVFATAMISLGTAARRHGTSPWFLVVISVTGSVFGWLAWRKHRAKANTPAS
jgi:uncharacterized membrane protein YdjX (TVP38/TMEM64 family)